MDRLVIVTDARSKFLTLILTAILTAILTPILTPILTAIPEFR